MPARTGNDYIEGLRAQPREVWIDGERVEDVTSHPALCNGARSVAALYDMQHLPALRGEMTYASPTTGDQVGLSFLQTRTLQDLERRRRMFTHWARFSGGMMGRSPDHLNAILMALAAAGPYFAQNRPEYGDNLRRYYEHVREQDLALTHTLVNLRRSRPASGMVGPEQEAALRAVRQTDTGVIVRGARVLATLGPISDEILVFPSTVQKLAPGAEQLALGFAIPCGTPGLKFICRESFDLGRSNFDHPLGSRFEEMDALVIFDDVLVPWERVFFLGDVEICNGAMGTTNAVAHMMHHVINKNVVKSEFLLGIACLMTETLGSTQLPQIQEYLAELIIDHGVMKACLRAAEADAAVDRWGIMCPSRPPLGVARNLFPKMYPRMVEILQLLGSSSLMAIQTQADFDSPLASDLEYYMATDTASGRERARLFRLGWDVACSSFGSRQVLYERFFSGDPARLASLLYSQYDKGPATQWVREFLGQQEASITTGGAPR